MTEDIIAHIPTDISPESAGTRIRFREKASHIRTTRPIFGEELSTICDKEKKQCQEKTLPEKMSPKKEITENTECDEWQRKEKERMQLESHSHRYSKD
jgi:hypothetical protein